MAFSLAQATGQSYPLPWAPQIRRKYRSIIVLRIAALLVQWMTLIGMYAWFGAAWLLALFPAWLMPQLPQLSWAIILGMTVMIGVSFITSSGVNTPLIRTFGYGRASMNTVSGRHPKPPASVKHTVWAVIWIGASLGIVLGTGLGCLQAAGTDATGDRLLLLGAAAAVLAGLFVWAGVHAARKAMAGWREELQRERIAEQVRSHGVRVTGNVIRVDFKENWLDQQPIFTLCVEYRAADEVKTVEFHYVDYPRWAPAVGNEFVVWYDPDHLDDPRYTLLERKIVGQTFDADIERLRRPASGGDGPGIGPIEPGWAQGEKQNKPRVTVRIAILVSVACLFAAGVSAAAAGWIAAFGFAPWWMLSALLLFTAVHLLNVVCGISLLVRARWLIRMTWSVVDVGWVGFVLMYPSLLGVIVMIEPVLDGTSTFHGVLLLFTGLTVVLGGIAGVIVSTSYEEAVARLFTSGSTPPADEVHEALRAGNPAALEALEERYGYIAGPLHTHC